MENLRYEVSPAHATPREAYEQNYGELLELMGRINGRLSTQYRTDQPRSWEHIGKQEELIAMLLGVLEMVEA